MVDGGWRMKVNRGKPAQKGKVQFNTHHACLQPEHSFYYLERSKRVTPSQLANYLNAVHVFDVHYTKNPNSKQTRYSALPNIISTWHHLRTPNQSIPKQPVGGGIS